MTENNTLQGLWSNNPALVQLLGLCPLLAVSNIVANSLVLGIVTLLVLTGSNFIISLIRHRLDDSTRLPAQIMIIATFVTIGDLLVQTFMFDIHQRIGLFIALIVTNCAILGRAEGFARRNGVGAAAIDGFMMGLGFLIALLCMGVIREALGNGTLFSQMHLVFGGSESNYLIQLPNEPFLLVLLPPGAFLVLGCLIALKNVIDQRYSDQQSQTTISSRQTLPDQL